MVEANPKTKILKPRLIRAQLIIVPSIWNSWCAVRSVAALDFSEDTLKDKSLFQLVTLTQLLVGHLNYVATCTCSCKALEELFGDQFWHRQEKPEDVVHEDDEP